MWWTYALLAPGLALTALVALMQAGLHFSGRDVTACRHERGCRRGGRPP